MAKKQDRQGVRTAADIERKYNLGQSVTQAYVQSTVRSAVAVATNETKSYVDDKVSEVAEQEGKIKELERVDTELSEAISDLEQADAEMSESISNLERAVADLILNGGGGGGSGGDSVTGVVKSVNGIEPDIYGAVVIETNDLSDVEIADLMSHMQ